MTEFTAIMLGSVAVMFFFAYSAFKLLEVDKGEKRTHEALSLLLFMGAIIMSWTVLNLGVQINTANAGPLAIEDGVGYTYYIAVIVGSLTMIYFVLRLLVGSAKAAIQRKRLKIE